MNKDTADTVEWGTPSIDRARCTACELCVGICSSGTLRTVEGKPSVVTGGKFGCLACGHCVAICPKGAIRVTGRGMKADDGFPLPPVGSRATPEALAALLQARRSVRRYTDEAVDPETIDRVLAMAATAPMGFPPSPVGVVVINGKARVQELAEDLMPAFKKWLFMRTSVGSFVMRLMMDRSTRDLMRTYVLPVASEILEARKDKKDLLFYGAPCVLIFHYPMKDTIDPAIACSFATVAAESFGLGSCMIGTVSPALQGDKKLKTKWGVPEGRFVSIAMILGYPAVKFRNGVHRRFASQTRI
jgi:ferredoxin